MNKANLYRYLAIMILIAESRTAAAATPPAQDLLSLPLEELLKLEVTPRQPYRGDVPLEDLPQAVHIITSTFIQEVGISTFQDALNFSSDVVRTNSFGNTWDSFAIRGFAGDDNLPGGYFVNGFSAGRGFSGLRDTSNIQQIEVLKGAGAALYGRSEPGGTINIVTKKPKFKSEGYLQASINEENTYRLEGDYTSAATSNLAVRINGAYEDAKSFRDTVESKKHSLNPSLLFCFSEQAHLTYEMELLHQEISFDRGVAVANNDFTSIEVTRFYGEPNDRPLKIVATGHQLTYEQDIKTQWHLLAGLGYRDSSLEGYSTEPELSPSRQLLFTDGITLNRQRRYRDFDARDFSARLELSGEYQLAGLVNHLLLGVDNYQYQLTQLQDVWQVNPGDTIYAVSWQSPVYGQTSPELLPFWNLQEQEHAIGWYLRNQMEISDRWTLLAGFRYDKLHRDVENFLDDSAAYQDHDKIAPHLGAALQTSKLTSLYINYSEGFRPNTGLDATGRALQPEESRSYEIGSHFSSSDKTLTGSLAFFRAEKSNMITSDPVNAGYPLALGRAESEGVEFDINAALNDDITVSFAYTFVDAHTSNTMINPEWGVAIPPGSQLLNIPRHKANLTLRNNLTMLQHKGHMGFAVTYVGDRLGDAINPDYILPGYTTVRFFSAVDLTDKLQLNVQIDNLFNKEHFVNSYSALWTQPGNPRTARLALVYKY